MREVCCVAPQEKPAGVKKSAKKTRGAAFGASVDEIW